MKFTYARSMCGANEWAPFRPHLFFHSGMRSINENGLQQVGWLCQSAGPLEHTHGEIHKCDSVKAQLYTLRPHHSQNISQT